MRYPNQAGYYWEQASRVRKRAEQAESREARDTLLELAQRWERLAVSAEPVAELEAELITEIGLNDVEEQLRQEAMLFMKRHPANPAVDASHHARRAYDTGDMIGYELWTRMARMILEMDRRRPRKQGIH